MGEALQYKVNKFQFTADHKAVDFDIEISSDAPSGTIVYLYAAVGAEDPQLVARGRMGKLEAQNVSITKTLELVGGGPGNKPVTLMAYACWVYNEKQAVNWIKANAAIAAQASAIYLG